MFKYHNSSFLFILFLYISIILFYCSYFLVLDPLKYVLFNSIKSNESINFYSLFSLLKNNIKGWSIFLVALNLLSICVFLIYFFRVDVQCYLKNKDCICEYFLVAFLILFGISYLDPGYLLGGDTLAHYGYINHKYLAFKNDIYLNWDNFWNAGQHIYSYYSFSTFTIISVLAIVIKNPLIALKLYLFGCHVGSGLFMYRLLCKFSEFRLSALCGALIYSSSMAIKSAFLYQGLIPQFLTLLILPIFLDQIYMYCHKKSDSFFTKRLVLIWLLSGLLIMTYVPLALVWGFIGFCFIVFFLWPFKGEVKKIIYFLLSLVPIFLLDYDIFYVILFDTQQAISSWNISVNQDIINSIKKMVTWTIERVGFSGKTFAYVGISTILVVPFSLMRMNSRVNKFIILYFLCVLLFFVFFEIALVRNIFPIVASLSILFVFGFDFLFSKFKYNKIFSLMIFLFVLLDLFSVSVIMVGRKDKEHYITIGNYLTSHSDSQRTLSSSEWPHKDRINVVPGGEGISLEMTYPYPVLLGSFGPLAGEIYNYFVFVGFETEAILNREKKVTKELANLLCFNGVDKIIHINSLQQTGFDSSQFKDVTPNPVLGNYYHLACKFPFVVSGQLRRDSINFRNEQHNIWKEEFIENADLSDKYRRFYQDFFTEMEYDRTSSQSKYLFVEEAFSEDVSDRKINFNPEKINIRLVQFKVDYKKIDVQFDADSDGYLQLPYDFNKYQVVYVNGQKVQAIQGITNFIIIPFKKGSNTIAVVADVDNEMYRDIGTVVIYTFFLGLFCLLWYRERNYQK